MGKLSKIISLILAIIFVFAACSGKYDIVDHNDYSSALLDNSSSNGDIDIFTSGSDIFSNITSYEELISNQSVINSLPQSSSSSYYGSSNISTGGSSSKKPSSVITTTTSKSTTTSTPQVSGSTYTPVYYSNPTKAIWLSYYNFYYDIKDKNATTFRAYAKNIMQTVKNFGFNTIIVHLRSHGDAIYESAYYPWSSIVGGVSPGYDPTQILIEEAHAVGLSFHAWFNPLRLDTPQKLATVNNKYLTKQWYNSKYGDYVVKSGSYCYLNPAYSEVRNLVINGAKEIAQKYKVDALHIDDYFYPTTAASFDSKAFSALGAGKTLANFRRNNINLLVKGIYSAVKGVNSKLKFGISPGGNIDRNYSELYADTTLWLQNNGYMDYCMPQIYWGYEHNTADYVKMVNLWKSKATNSNVSLIIGIGYYKVNNTDYKLDGGSDEWVTDYTIPARQVTSAKTLLGSKYKGVAIFDYDYLFKETSTFHNNAKNELNKVI